MTPWERIETAIQFLLEHAARFDARLQRTEEQVQHTQKQIQQTQQELRETVRLMRESGMRTDAQIAGLIEQHKGVAQEIAALKDACRDLLDHAHYTDWRLGRLEHPNA